MDAARISSPGRVQGRWRSSLVAIGVALLLNHVVVEVEDDDPMAVRSDLSRPGARARSSIWSSARRLRGRAMPRWLAILVAYVIFFAVVRVPRPPGDPADRRARSSSSDSQLPSYVKDFENWANDNEQFRELNDKYDITRRFHSRPPSYRPSSAMPPAPLKEITVGILNNVIEAVDVARRSPISSCSTGAASSSAPLASAARPGAREGAPDRRPGRRDRPLLRFGQPAARGAGRGVHLARRSSCSESSSRCRLGYSSACFDLVPLIGFTVGGVLVAVVAALPRLPRPR